MGQVHFLQLVLCIFLVDRVCHSKESPIWIEEIKHALTWSLPWGLAGARRESEVTWTCHLQNHIE